MKANLSWGAAKEIALVGGRVRRAHWLDRWVFYPRRNVAWLGLASGAHRVVQSEDFTRAEFLALDWTDSAADQGLCIGIVPPTAVLTLSPSAVLELGTSEATLAIPTSLAVDQSFQIAVSPFGRATSPSAVTIPAGSTSVTFDVTAVDVDLPSGVIVSAISPLYGLTQAELQIGEYIAPPLPVVLNFSAGGRSGTPEAIHAQQPVTVANPFAAGCTVIITGDVDDHLLLNGQIVRTTWGGTFDPVQFQLAPGGSFTFAARDRDSRGFLGPNYCGYNVAITLYL